MNLRLHDWTMKEDLAKVEAVRQAIGDRLTILVDANQAQQPGTARRYRKLIDKRFRMRGVRLA